MHYLLEVPFVTVSHECQQCTSNSAPYSFINFQDVFICNCTMLQFAAFIYRYGFDYGCIHFVMMSTEHNFTQGSKQYTFLVNHLKTVNRTKTPWLIFSGHRYPRDCQIVYTFNWFINLQLSYSLNQGSPLKCPKGDRILSVIIVITFNISSPANKHGESPGKPPSLSHPR